MCQPTRYVYHKCRHGIGPPRSWLPVLCTRAHATGFACWLPAHVPRSKMEDVAWPGQGAKDYCEKCLKKQARAAAARKAKKLRS